jgi:mono/diheme cytochrome c family protein
MMRISTLVLSATLSLCGGIAAVHAQDIANGERLSARWCSECHAIGTVPGNLKRTPSFAVIAAKQGVTTDVIAKFLLMPHATMPNEPLSPGDAEDIAGFIMAMKK